MKRGDIVLLAFPFSDGSGTKIRPALVVQSDRNNRRLTNTIVAMISSATQRADSESSQLRIDLHSSAGKKSGLLMDSAIKCVNLFTIAQQAVVRIIGHLPAREMNRVDACLRSTLGLR